MSSWPLIIKYCPSLYLVIFLALTSILTDKNIATSAFFWLVFTWCNWSSLFMKYVFVNLPIYQNLFLTYINHNQHVQHFLCHSRIAKIMSCLTCMFPGEVEPGNVFSSCFSPGTVSKCAFHGLFGLSCICTFCLCIYCLIQPLIMVGLLSSVPKCKEVAMCPMGEIIR